MCSPHPGRNTMQCRPRGQERSILSIRTLTYSLSGKHHVVANKSADPVCPSGRTIHRPMGSGSRLPGVFDLPSSKPPFRVAVTVFRRDRRRLPTPLCFWFGSRLLSWTVSITVISCHLTRGTDRPPGSPYDIVANAFVQEHDLRVRGGCDN